jgi:VanZ family protein
MNDSPQSAILKVPVPLRVVCLPLAGVLILSLFSAAPSLGGVVPVPWDMLAHLGFYGAIGVLIAVGLRGWPYWLPLLATCAIGIADEFYQSTLPGRVASTDDLIMDIVAAALATALVYRRTRT